MDQIYYAARTFNQLALVVLMLLVMVLIADPRLAGTWLAERDVAYDHIWMTYVADCDCTDSLE